MGRCIIIVLFAFFSVGITSARGESAREALEALGGTWKTVAIVSDGKTVQDETIRRPPGPEATLVYKGDTWHVIVGEKTVASGKLKVDPDKNPRQLDVLSDDDPKGAKTKLAIYQLDGDTFKYCIAGAGKPRPTEFASKAGSGESLITSKRVKP